MGHLFDGMHLRTDGYHRAVGAEPHPSAGGVQAQQGNLFRGGLRHGERKAAEAALLLQQTVERKGRLACIKKGQTVLFKGAFHPKIGVNHRKIGHLMPRSPDRFRPR